MKGESERVRVRTRVSKNGSKRVSEGEKQTERLFMHGIPLIPVHFSNKRLQLQS